MTPQRTLQRSPAVRSAALAIAIVACAVGAVRGEEEFQRFLDALRDRGLNDMALDYLAEMRGSRLIDEETRSMIPYEEAATLVRIAAVNRDADQKSRQLDEAQQRFTEFVAQSPDHPLAASAESQLANILVERARAQIARSERPANAAQKDQLVAEARGMLEQAQKVFEAAEKKFLAQLEQFPKLIPSSDTKSLAARTQARNALVQARLFAGQSFYEAAHTYPAKSKEAKELLTKAAAKFGEIYDKYESRFLAGVVARIRQGQCQQEMGDSKGALEIFSEVLLLPDENEDVRRLKATALKHAMETWSTDEVKNYDEAIRQGRDWLARARGAESNTADGLALQYELAATLKKQAATLKANQKSEQRELLTEARKLANQVASFAGDYRAPAKALVAELYGAADAEEKPPANFAEARDRGKDALDVFQALQSQLQLAGAVGGESGAQEIETQAKDARKRAQDALRLALDMRDETTPIDEVNQVRYFLCYLNFQAGDHLAAAVVGEFLTRNYPDDPLARRAALIALASYLQLYNDQPAGKREFEQARMLSIADFVTRRWADEPEAADAWTILMTVAGQEQQPDKVLEYLTKIPEASPRRAEAEMKAGQALWAAYLRAASQDAESRPQQAELEGMRDAAQQTLEKALKRQTGGVDAATATAALSLAQLYVGADKDQQALDLLNNEGLGPLVLVTSGNPLAQQGNFATETLKLALRAYVATQQLDKAAEVMQRLESTVGQADSDALTRIYIALGRELEQQLAQLRDENKTEQLGRVAAGFELFLDKIASRPDGASANALNWVAETYGSLAAGFEKPSGPQSREALAYFEKSIAADQAILDRAQQEEGFASPDLQLLVQMRMARNERRSGNFRDAIDRLTAILKQKPTLLDVQIEAAMALQDQAEKNPKAYPLAIGGAGKYKDANGREANLIWGWARLALMTERHPQYREQFHQARYSLAKCRLLLAKTQSGDEKTQTLARADQEIQLTARLHPDLRTSDWFEKYDALLKTIQKELGREVTGLQGTKSGSQSAKTGPGTAAR